MTLFLSGLSTLLSFLISYSGYIFSWYFISATFCISYIILVILQVLNGLLSRGDQKEAISIPIGIIPAGSDNSLVWTVLGVRDPVSAALAIVKVALYSNSCNYSFLNMSSAFTLKKKKKKAF